MFKGILVLVILISTAAFADKSVVCVNREIQDSSIIAKFTLKEVGSKVDLSIPWGETNSKTFSGECKREEGAIELAVTCIVLATSDLGYEVKLFSIGGSSLFATVKALGMSPFVELISLRCDK